MTGRTPISTSEKLVDAQAIIIEVARLRKLQKEYFKTKNKDLLTPCKDLERNIDRMITEYAGGKQTMLPSGVPFMRDFQRQAVLHNSIVELMRDDEQFKVRREAALSQIENKGRAEGFRTTLRVLLELLENENTGELSMNP